MSGPAKVYSTDAVDAIRLALVMFVDRVSDALSELSAEMRRVQEWLEHDRPKYWKNQTRIAMDREHEAQQALHRCLMFPIGDERPSCYEERAELKKAQHRLAYCRDKCDRVRHWQQTLRHELFEYEGRMTQLMKLIEVDVPEAIGVLSRITRALEEYRALREQDPRRSYDDVGLSKSVWTTPDAENKDGVTAKTITDGDEEPEGTTDTTVA